VLHVALTGETDGYYADFGSMSAIAKVITQAFSRRHVLQFRGRDHGRPVDTLVTPSWRFIGYSQDHDQVVNRAAGDQLTSQLDTADLAIAAVLVLTGRAGSGKGRRDLSCWPPSRGSRSGAGR